jgi:hypothetical protein
VVSLVIEVKSCVTPERRGQNPHLTPFFFAEKCEIAMFTLFRAKFPLTPQLAPRFAPPHAAAGSCGICGITYDNTVHSITQPQAVSTTPAFESCKLTPGASSSASSVAVRRLLQAYTQVGLQLLSVPFGYFRLLSVTFSKLQRIARNCAPPAAGIHSGQGCGQCFR